MFRGTTLLDGELIENFKTKKLIFMLFDVVCVSDQPCWERYTRNLSPY